MKNTGIAGMIVVTMIIALFSGVVIGKASVTDRTPGTVKAICDYSRTVTSGEAEEACGIAQDINKMEYLCKTKGSKTIDCWVEQK